ncbi:hypothetical protein HaLaN_23384 [Haematococcus lacustris]|uniref:Uncharacterized protein n=1 Tax=Haematococcus lacustris TaxID=44745 RepID=A0A699ZW68_HAELA|nr:hypothetical protein HaLaN_23384 [Haematococcus lacustris]
MSHRPSEQQQMMASGWSGTCIPQAAGGNEWGAGTRTAAVQSGINPGEAALSKARSFDRCPSLQPTPRPHSMA